MDTIASKHLGRESVLRFLAIFPIYILVGQALQWPFFTPNLTVSLAIAAILWNNSESIGRSGIRLNKQVFLGEWLMNIP